MVCAPCMVTPLVAGGTGIATVFRKNTKLMYIGISLIILGVITYRSKDTKTCETCPLKK